MARLFPVAVMLAAALGTCGVSLSMARAADEKTPAFVSDRLSVEVIGTGAGPEVVMLAGYACSVEIWRPLATRLATRHRVHLVQPGGFAGKPWPHGDSDFVQPLAAEIARYLQQQGLRTPAMIGHSLGGTVALVIAQKHPGLLGRVMTVDSLPYLARMFGEAKPEMVRAQAQSIAAVLLTADPAAFRVWQSQSVTTLTTRPEIRSQLVEWALQSDRHALAAGIRDVMTLDLRPGLAAMTVPLWAVYAADEKDGARSGAGAALWQREYAPVPKLKLIGVEGSRHFIMTDQPAKLDAIVDDFLRP